MKKTIDNLVHEAYQLYSEIREKTAHLRELKSALSAAALYKPGSKTGSIFTDHYKVKIQQKENERWDQDTLNGLIRRTLGEEKFFQLFRFKFEPIAKQLSGYLEHGPDEHKALLLSARSVSPGTPAITFELIEDAE